jgi:hypothetical protein
LALVIDNEGRIARYFLAISSRALRSGILFMYHHLRYWYRYDYSASSRPIMNSSCVLEADQMVSNNAYEITFQGTVW